MIKSLLHQLINTNGTQERKLRHSALDEQRVEINEIAQDVDNLPNLGSFSVTT